MTKIKIELQVRGEDLRLMQHVHEKDFVHGDFTKGVQKIWDTMVGKAIEVMTPQERMWFLTGALGLPPKEEIIAPKGD